MALVHWDVQKSRFSCGAACLRNALQVLGRSVTEHEVRRRARTTPHGGTSEHDMIRAIHSYGYRARVGRWANRVEDRAAAWKWLCDELDAGHPVILNVDDLSHWVLAVGRMGNKVAVSDPQRSRGIVPGRVVKLYGRRTFLKRWWCSAPARWTAHGVESEYYGIALRPRTRAAKLRAAIAPRVTGDVLRRILGSDSVYIADVAKDLRTLFPARSGREHEPAGDFLERHQETLLAAIRYWAKASDGRRLRAEFSTYIAVARAMPNLAAPRNARRVIANLTAMFAMNGVFPPSRR